MNPRGNRRAPAPRPASAAPTRVEAQPEPPTCQDVITHLTDDPKLGRCIRLRRLESSKKLKAEMVATPPTPGRVWLGGEKVTARSNYKYIEKHNSAEPTLRTQVRSHDSIPTARAAPTAPQARRDIAPCIDSRSRGLALRPVAWWQHGWQTITMTITHADHSHTQAPPWRIGSEIVRCHSKDITI